MNKTCMIAEADPFIARLLKRFAEESGLDPVVARAGQDVMALARQVKPVVIVLDVELPGTVQGWEVAQALLADRETFSIPVILCSWLEEANGDALTGQVASYLRKPELYYEDFTAALKLAGVALQHD